MKTFFSKIIFLTSAFLFPIYLTGCQSVKVNKTATLIPKVESDFRSVPPSLSEQEPVECEAAEGCFNQAKKAENNGKREKARSYLKIMMDRYPDSPWFQRGGYLLGKWEIESKSSNGEGFLLKIQKNYPEMGDYIIKMMGDLAFNQADFPKAIQEYDHLLVIYPDTVLRSQALYKRGESLFQLKEYEKAGQTFEAFYRENPKDEKTPEVLNKLGDIYAEKQEWAKAAFLYREIQWKYPDSIWSQEAEKKSALIQPKAGNPELFKLTLQEEFDKGRILYETGRFDQAVETWQKVRKKATLKDHFFLEMELKMGIAFLPLKKFPEAADQFYRVLKKAPASDFAQEALLGLVRIAIREESESDLLKYKNKSEKLFPHTETYYKILYFLGAYYEDHNQFIKAHSTFQRIIKELPNSSIAPDALWKEGWIYYKEGDNLTAKNFFSTLIEQYAVSPLRPQALYWKGRALEQMGEVDASQLELKKVCDGFGHSYYCYLAKKRLPAVPEQVSSPQQQEGSLPAIAVDSIPSGSSLLYQQDDHYRKAKELMTMNLALDASKEFNYLADHYNNNDKTSLLQIDQELIQAGDFFHALKNLRTQFPDILERGKTYEFPLLWRLAYPKEVLELIKKTVTNSSVEPEFIAGIMREESVFDLRATSKSGAIGLMQLMPFTGEWAAQRLGIPLLDKEQLYGQEVNIRMGAYYLDTLNQKFQGNLIYTAASYNAGPEAVNKWIEKGNFKDSEEFVENIPYQETRYYVKKVIKSYEEFKQNSS